MLKFCAIFFLFSLAFITPTADRSKMAIFDLKKMSGDEYHLKATFDRINLLKVLKSKYSVDNEDSLSVPLTDYLENHTAFYFDEEPVEITWQAAKTGTQFVSIEAKVYSKVNSPYNIRILNDCLVDEISQHSNLVRIYLYEGKRIFKLDFNLKSTLVQYQNYKSE